MRLPDRFLLVAALALIAAAAVVAAAARGDDPGPVGLRIPAPSPDAVVAGGETPWIHSGPTGRAALREGWTMARGDGGPGWRRGRFDGISISVPYVPNTTVTGPEGVRNMYGDVLWYRRPLHVRRSGEYVLRFESVNHRATVWVDGRRVVSHAGVYLPFEARVRLDARRVHQLVVRADFRDPDQMKAAGYHRTWFNFGGINREVTLRRAGASELGVPTVRTRLRGRDAVVDVSVEARNWSSASRTVPVAGELSRGGQRVRFTFPDARLAAHDGTVLRTRVVVPHADLWSTTHPALYDLAMATGDSQAAWRGRVGLRELTWNRGRLELNGRPLRLRGASLHEDARGRGDALRPPEQNQLVRSLSEVDANATRAQHPLDQGLLERLDAAGIVVWLGIGPIDSPGAWTSTTPRRRRIARQRTIASVRQAQVHPSIVAWNLANELGGNGHDASQVAYLRKMTRELHERDPGRLVALDVWGAHPPSHMGAVYRDVDAIGITNYQGWYEDTFLSPAALRRAIRHHITHLMDVFDGKVVVVTEFGAEGNALNAAGSPGSLGFQARVLASHLRVYGGTPGLDGELVWNLRDFAVTPRFAGGTINRIVPGIQLVKGINQKGLFTYDGTAKPAVAVVRRAFRR